METNELQQQLFTYLKENIPQHISLVDELCDLLGLSPDSVYRRIRGEKPISLAELKRICEHYHLSIDQLLQLENDTVLFDAPGMNGAPGTFVDYMKAVLRQFKYFNSFKSREIHYLCKDSTIWNFFLFPELAAFKTFFWSKTINNQPDLHNKSFSFEEFPFTDCFELGQQVLREYNQIPCVELWNLESMHSTINQIAYYKDAGNFRTSKDFEAVLSSFQQTIAHLQLQAEKGVKFMPGDSDVSYKAPIQFYVNELILGNNTMAMKLDGIPLTMVTYSVFHYLFTKDPRFFTKVMSSFDTLLGRSTLISKTGEKDRNRFFNSLRQKVNSLAA
ncbi:MAG TPA: helix-turn-helix domain-containing protein [Chitinophagaceae bacterium]|nr:helix-turn-helix domain-containing protein [Chitinophagaceae bacterium]